LMGHKWQVASGNWQVANGKWQVASGRMQEASGKWQWHMASRSVASGKWQVACIKTVYIVQCTMYSKYHTLFSQCTSPSTMHFMDEMAREIASISIRWSVNAPVLPTHIIVMKCLGDVSVFKLDDQSMHKSFHYTFYGWNY
jgi:hypothetical protein